MMEYAPTCDGCRQIYAERKPPQEPPCETCREVPFEDNQDAIRIFFLIKEQLIMGINGPVDVNHLAIHEAMKLYRIRNRRECFEKVLHLSRWWLERIVNKDETSEGWGQS